MNLYQSFAHLGSFSHRNKQSVEAIDKTSPETNSNTLLNKGWLKVLQIIDGIGSGKSSHFSFIAGSGINLKIRFICNNNAFAKVKSATCTVI